MSRRLFVRRLVAGGMALGTAVSYAHLLAPEAVAKRPEAHANLYDPPRILSLEMLPDNLERVIRERRVRVRATASEPETFYRLLYLFRSPDESPFPRSQIGEGVLEFQQVSTPTTFNIPIFDGNPLMALRKLQNATMGLEGANAIEYPRLGSVTDPLVELEMVPQDLDQVISQGRVRVRGTAAEAGSYPMYLHLYRSPARTQWPDAAIGVRTLIFPAANQQRTFAIPLTPNGILALQKQRRSARIGVHPDAQDVQPGRANAILYER